MIEVLIAIGVVSTGILALLAVFVTGTRSNQHGEDLSKAVYYARRISEIVRANGLAFNEATIPPPQASGINDPAGVFKPLNSDPPIQLATIRAPKLNRDTGLPELNGSGDPVPDPGDDKFERNIMIRRSNNSPADFRYNLLTMDVTVRWVGGRSGDGMRHVKITSLLKSGS
ncbi:MAG: hypothetical protein KC800_15440 [Candidatus Eremiobacteraeota bacterium]|nr:hypothetical protein [Candidatus Eremiobacteraeota bacterium]